MSIDLCHGILTTVLTEQEQAGVESVVSVTAGLGGKTLLIVGRRSETTPMLMLNLTAREKAALIRALQETP